MTISRFLLILLVGTVFSAVTSQPTPCATSTDCPESFYCNSVNNLCLKVGSCVEVADCDDPTNIGFAQVMCLGTNTCENGQCGINCGEFPPKDSPCTTTADCASGLYCSSSGICTKAGMCQEVSDCDDPGNVFMRPACVGFSTCDNEMCGYVCGEGCGSSDECSDGFYCSSFDICSPVGSCNLVEDCTDPSNSPFPIAACLGNLECQSGRCAMNCNGSDAIGECTSSQDCMGGNEYCALDGICREYGTCSGPRDCGNRNNIFASIECIGTVTCDDNQCGKICDGQQVPNETPCIATEDCGMDEYCSSGGTCLPFGGCGVASDCDLEENGPFATPFCMGTFECQLGTCVMNCGNVPDSISQPVKDTIPASTPCAIDDECAVLDPEKEWYCSQGICAESGSCGSDFDCMNPANSLWDIKRCAGSVSCLDPGFCDRLCGMEICLDGSKPVQCFEDPCDVESCEGAVSCALDPCGGECTGLYFDAMGSVIKTCNGGSATPAVDDTRADPSVGSGGDKDLTGPTTTTIVIASAEGDSSAYSIAETMAVSLLCLMAASSLLLV